MEQIASDADDLAHDLSEAGRETAREQIVDRVAVARHHIQRNVYTVLQQVDRDILPEIGKLQGRTGGIGETLSFGVRIPAEIEHQPADRVRGIPAISEELFEIGVTRDALILDEGLDQIGERLAR